ncbi:MAG: phosphoenolpyruvate--protein phosphotransferase [Ruminococcus sp.]|nr:phosphoenolpyruvate--protein phosphotransferase [Ruminococcus sp.]
MVTLYGRSVYEDICIGKIFYKKPDMEGICGKALTGPLIIAAKELTPADTKGLPDEKMAGFLLEQGAGDSYAGMLAKSLGIPALIAMQTHNLEEYDGHQVILDGENGTAYIDPDEETYAELQERKRILVEKKLSLQALKGKETVTADGNKIHLYADVSSLQDIDNALDNDAEGIGLFRSEFLYLENEDFPEEEQQFEAYKQALVKMKDKKVIIRTLAVGTDKAAPYFRLEKESNPALGCRGLRICLSRPEILKTQLRALYRAGCYGSLGILIPMVISLEEVLMVKEIAAQVKQELREEGIAYQEEVELGVMIETPAAALISEKLAKEADFFCVGTNHLGQFTMAIDRANKSMQSFFDPHHEAVLKLIEMSVQAAHQEGKRAGVCEEMAADEELLEFLVKMGVDEFIITSDILLEMRKKIREIS